MTTRRTERDNTAIIRNASIDLLHCFTVSNLAGQRSLCLINASEAPSMRVSVVITAHNEGREVNRTIESVIRNTTHLHEILLVDDGSTDDSCTGFVDRRIHVVRHDRRVGVAYSRHEATQQATGDACCYLDAHQRVGPGCIDRCADVALAKAAIVSPTLYGLKRSSGPLYGATFELCPTQGYFSARWLEDKPSERVLRCTALRGPGYVIPRAVYDRVAWIKGLRGWGGSEAVINLKAFSVPDNLVRHLEKPCSNCPGLLRRRHVAQLLASSRIP